MATFAGEVEVTVVPDTTGFRERLQGDLEAAATRVAENIGRQMGAVMGARISASVRDAMDTGTAAATSGAVAGKRFGMAFGSAANAQIRASLRDQTVNVRANPERAKIEIDKLKQSLRNMPDIRLRLTSGDSTRVITEVKAKLAELHDQKVTVRVETAEAMAKLRAMVVLLDRIGARHPRVKVTADVDSAVLRLAALRAQLDRLNGTHARPQVTVGGTSNASMGLRGILMALLPLAPALIPIGAAATGAMAAIALGAIAAATGVGVLALALVPVIGAITAVIAAKGKDTAASARSASSALQLASAHDAVTSAERGLVSATAEAALARQRADEKVSQAERDLTDAHKAVLDAETALADARAQARIDLEDMQARSADGVLAERQSVIALKDAQEQLAATLKDPAATALDRQKAQLAVDQAVQGLKEQQTENARLKTQVTDANKAGIEGSKGVAAAHQAVTDAQRKEADQQQALTDAIRDAADQQRRSADAIISAQQGVVSAQRGVQQASAAAGNAGGQAMDTVRQKMAALTPAGRSFVLFVTGTLMPALKGLSGAAQQGFLPGFQSGIKSLMPALPGFTVFVGDLATVMGDLAAQAGKALMSPFWKDFFTYIDKTAGPTLEQMGKTFGNFSAGFAGILEAFEPIRKQFGDGLYKLSQKFADFGKSAGKSKDFQDFLKYVKENGPRVVSTFGALVGAFANIARALAPAGPLILDMLTGISNFVARTDPQTLRDIGVAILTVVVAFRTATIAIAATNVVLGIFGIEAMAATWPIWLVVGVIAALAYGFYLAYTRSQTFRNIVSAAWLAIRVAAMAAWTLLKKNAVDPLVHFFSVTIPNAAQKMVLLAMEAWNGLHNGVAKVWDGIKGDILHPMRKFLTNDLPNAFSAGVDACETAWNKLVGIAKWPVEFLINTVINKGIIDTWNKVADMFGASRGIHVGLPGGWNKLASTSAPSTNRTGKAIAFAAGGYISGPGGPTSDRVPAMLSNGEYVLRAGAVARLGTSFVDVLNRADTLQLSGDPAALVMRRRGFADGGLVADVKNWLPGQTSHPYVWGGVGPGGFDCSGLVGEVWARLTSHPSWHRYMTTASDFGALGFRPGTGMFTIGVNDHHMDGSLGGLRFEAPHTGVNIRVGSAAQPTSNFPRQYYLASLGTSGGDKGGGGGGGFSLNPLDYARGLFNDALAPLREITKNPWGKLLAGMPKSLVNLAIHDLGLFDDGGYLPPGISTVLNGTGRPEPVFSDSQWDTMKSSGQSPTIGPVDVRVWVGDREITDIVRTEVHAAEQSTVARVLAGTAYR